MKSLRALATAVGMAVLLAACGNPQAAESPTTEGGTRPVASPTTSPSVPPSTEEPFFLTEAFGYSPADIYVITLAQATLIAECMDRKGSPQPLVGVSNFTADSEYHARLRFRLLMDDPARVATTGYQWPTPEVEQLEYVGDSDELDQMLNDPVTGCRTAALDALGVVDRVLANVDRSLAELEGATISEVTTGDRFQTLRGDWTKCMAAEGFPDMSFMSNTSGAGLDVAAADAECRQTTGLTAAIASFLIQTRDEYAAAHAEELAALSAARQIEASNAKAVLAERGISPDPSS